MAATIPLLLSSLSSRFSLSPSGSRWLGTAARRLCTIAGFYKYAVEEELLDHSPTAHVRRPRR